MIQQLVEAPLAAVRHTLVYRGVHGGLNDRQAAQEGFSRAFYITSRPGRDQMTSLSSPKS